MQKEDSNNSYSLLNKINKCKRDKILFLKCDKNEINERKSK